MAEFAPTHPGEVLREDFLRSLGMSQYAATEQGYATAVRDIGASPWRIYGHHILPNIASTLIVSMTLNFPEVILLESGLAFLGSACSRR